jgi:hypothetical protein
MMFHFDMNSGIDPAELARLKLPPTGRYAYARGALYAAVAIAEEAFGRSKYKPNILIQIPPPPVFNAFCEPSVYVRVAGAKLSSVEKSIFGGRNAVHGDIFISDAIPATILFLSSVRHLLLSSTAGASEFDAAGSEVLALFAAWDAWKYDSQLDLSQSRDIPTFNRNATPDGLAELAFKHDTVLIGFLLLVLAHEHGHVIEAHSGELSQSYRPLAKTMIDDLFKALRDIKESRYSSLEEEWRNDRAVERAWISEVAADIFAMQALMFQKTIAQQQDSLDAFSMLCSIQNIIECYVLSRYGEYSNTHPMSQIRMMLGFRYAYNITEGRIPELQSLLNVRHVLCVGLRELLLGK